MDTLRQNENCTQFLKDFLDYIQKKMLVDKNERERSDMVRAKLSRMLDDCQQDCRYASFQASVQPGLQHGDTMQPTVSRWRRITEFLCG